MNGFNYYVKVLKNYVNFKGRARRSEYWYFILFNSIISFAVGFVGGILGDENGSLGMIYSLGIMLPSIAVAVRRAHDTNHSGWFILIPFYNLYLMFKEGDEGANDYGADPKNDKIELEDNLVG